MSREATFGPDVIRDQFHELAERLDESTTVYLIGGGALTLSNLKNATRDIDLIVESATVSDLLLRALSSAGYDPIDDPEDDYEVLDAAFIVQHGPRRFDVFNRRVFAVLVGDPPAEDFERDPVVTIGLLVVVGSVDPADDFLGFIALLERVDDPADLLGNDRHLPEELDVPELGVLRPEECQRVVEGQKPLAASSLISSDVSMRVRRV